MIHPSYRNGLNVDEHGNQIWCLDGDAHRQDGPAIIYRNGRQEWWLDGKLHRADGPAIVFHDSRGNLFEWYQNGLRHRVDGPAYVSEYDRVEKWYQHDMLHRLDGPACSSPSAKEWFRNNQPHRQDGPAKMFWRTVDGDTRLESEHWYQDGQLHRADGPAIISYLGKPLYKYIWYWEGVRVTGSNSLGPDVYRRFRSKSRVVAIERVMNG